MAYSINPNLPKARAIALRMLIREELAVQVVANRCGVHRSTIYRWRKKWNELNKHVEFTNPGRPSRPVSMKNKLAHCRWIIATLSSAPHSSPHAIAQDVIDLAIKLRLKLKRCAEVIWHHLRVDEGVEISLSSVRRILRRSHLIKGRKKRVRPSNPLRPLPTAPGELVQTDTIHYVNRIRHSDGTISYRKRYVYTVIDLYTRMTHAEVHSSIRPGLAAQVILRAQDNWGFRLKMVQADNGTEFSSYFEQSLNKQGISIRHSRLGRPNDNAHIERFNRTVQEECLTDYIPPSAKNANIQVKLNKYIAYYNTQRVHLSLQLRTPVSMLQRS